MEFPVGFAESTVSHSNLSSGIATITSKRSVPTIDAILA